MVKITPETKEWYGYRIIYGKRYSKTCVIRYCRSRLTHKALICSKHRVKQWRENNPLRALYLQAKWNAKVKRIGFELTYSEFKNFIHGTGYDDKKLRGLKKTGLTIDRLDAREPYCLGNIEIKTRSENCSKGNRDRIDAYIMSKIL